MKNFIRVYTLGAVGALACAPVEERSEDSLADYMTATKTDSFSLWDEFVADWAYNK